MAHIIEDLAGDWRRLDERIEAVSSEIEELAQADEGAARPMSVPDIGPLISSATVAGIGKGDVFGKGRDFGASRSVDQGELTKVSTATRAIPPPTRRMSIVSLT